MILSRLSPLALVFGLSVFAVGCVEKPDDTGSADDSTTADDSSTTDDSATDDSGTTGEASFSGTATMTSVLDGATVCNVTTSLASSQDLVYTGLCPDCDFGFQIDSTITADTSTADCPYYYQLTWLPITYHTENFMGHFPTYYGYYGNYYDVFSSGYGIDYYYYYYPGPYWNFQISYDGSAAGTFSNNGGALSWTWDYIGEQSTDNYYYYCDYVEDLSGSGVVSGGDSGTGDVACDGLTVDVWSFEGDGSDVAISVDTVATNSAFDIHMFVNDENECTMASADDTFDCTYPPPEWQCPALEFTTTAQTYTVIVASFGSCATEPTGSYIINVKQDSDTNLTMIYDDADAATGVPFEIHSTGSGTITE